MCIEISATLRASPIKSSKGPPDTFFLRKSRKWTPEELLRAIDLVQSGVPIKSAAEKFRIPVMTLWRKTRALGIVSSRAFSLKGRRDKTESVFNVKPKDTNAT
ncbi:unnamed protein product [Tenebrio molitor]|jgi:transposase-like protein|nr:unnamed protein product [Tenebrio molitor]